MYSSLSVGPPHLFLGFVFFIEVQHIMKVLKSCHRLVNFHKVNVPKQPASRTRNKPVTASQKPPLCPLPGTTTTRGSNYPAFSTINALIDLELYVKGITYICSFVSAFFSSTLPLWDLSILLYVVVGHSLLLLYSIPLWDISQFIHFAVDGHWATS